MFGWITKEASTNTLIGSKNHGILWQNKVTNITLCKLNKTKTITWNSELEKISLENYQTNIELPVYLGAILN